MSKKLIFLIALVMILGALCLSCATKQTQPQVQTKTVYIEKQPQKPSEANFKDPVISLASFEVPQYDEYWYFSSKVEPTKGKAGDRGAPLPISFLFDIENPNEYPVLLEGIKYTVAFDKDFEVITTENNDSYWIPAGKTSQVRVTTLITVRSALTGLLLANAITLKERGWNEWETLEKWWNGVPELAVPVTAKECAFVFTAGDVIKVLPFEATVP